MSGGGSAAAYVEDRVHPPQPWIEGLELYGSLETTKFPQFNFLADKVNHSQKHWLQAPYDFWETRMTYLPNPYSYVKAFQPVIECYKPNTTNLQMLINLVAEAPNNAKIVAVMQETFGQSSDLVRSGHAFCAVFCRHPEGSGTDIIMHDVYSELRFELITNFFMKYFPKELESPTHEQLALNVKDGYNLDAVGAKAFKFEHCTDRCAEKGTLVNEDSCVMMTHLAAELELRSIVPSDNIITSNMQKGYASFLENPKRLTKVVVALTKVLKERMCRLAAQNTLMPKREIQFCILGKWFQTTSTFYFESNYPHSGVLIPLLMNYKPYFFRGDELDELLNDHLQKIVYELETRKRWETDGLKGYVK